MRIRPNHGSTCLLAAFALGCGTMDRAGVAVSSDAAASDSGIDATSAQQPQDGAPAGDGRYTVACSDGDYFIEVADDAGTLTLRSACADSGSDVPSFSSDLCAEDTPCFRLSACSGSASVVLGILVGSYLRSFTFDEGEAGACAGSGQIHFDNAPYQLAASWDGGAVAGDYDWSCYVFDDAGTATRVDAFSGRFCAHP